MAVHVGEAAFEAVVIPGELFVVEAEQMQHGSPEVVNGRWVFCDAAAEVICRAPEGGLLDACCQHPHCVDIGVVIAAKYGRPERED